MGTFFKKAYKFHSQHLIISNSVHAIGGFALASILQQYLVGNSFLPLSIDWILLVIVLIGHVYPFLGNN